MIGSLTNAVYAYLTSSEILLYCMRLAAPVTVQAFRLTLLNATPIRLQCISPQLSAIHIKKSFYLAPRITGNRRLTGAGEQDSPKSEFLSDSEAYTKEAMHRSCSNLATLLCQFFSVCLRWCEITNQLARYSASCAHSETHIFLGQIDFTSIETTPSTTKESRPFLGDSCAH